MKGYTFKFGIDLVSIWYRFGIDLVLPRSISIGIAWGVYVYKTYPTDTNFDTNPNTNYGHK